MAEVSTTRGRNFLGTVGLKAGFGDDGKLFERQVVLKAAEQWLKERHSRGEPYLGMKFGAVEDIVYGFEKGEDLLLFTEPVIAVSGEIASYHEHLSDDEIIATLTSLFEYLGKATMQTTVRFLYHGEGSFRISYRLRLPDTEHPLD